MASRVYVGRLSYRVRERDIERFFRSYGRIKEIMLKNGYGFVEFDDPRDADDAVYELNGRELCGERVVIEHAKGTPHGRDAWKDRERGIEYPRRDGYDEEKRPKKGYTCIVENLSSRVTKHDLKDFFRKAGDVVSVELKSDYGVVEFASSKDLKYAIDKYYGAEFFGRKIKLFEDKPKSKKRSLSRTPSSKSKTHSKSLSRSASPKKRRKSVSMEFDEENGDRQHSVVSPDRSSVGSPNNRSVSHSPSKE